MSQTSSILLTTPSRLLIWLPFLPIHFTGPMCFGLLRTRSRRYASGTSWCNSSSRDLVYMSCARGSRSATLRNLLRQCYSSLFFEERCSGPNRHFAICYLLTTTYIGVPRCIKSFWSFLLLDFQTSVRAEKPALCSHPL